MDLISELNSEIALAVLVEKRHRQKLEPRDAVEVICRVNSALEPLSHSNSEHTGDTHAGSLSNKSVNRDFYV